MHWDLVLIVGLALVVLSLHQKISNLEIQLRESNKHLGELVGLANQIEHHTERSSELLYGQTPEYRQHLEEIERLRS